MEEKELFICDDCGREFEEDYDGKYTTHDGKVVCEECANNNYFYCEDCCELVDNEDVVQVFTDGYGNNWTYSCEGCAERNYYRDWENGNYYESDNCGCYTHDGHFISEETYEQYYCCCEGCSEVFSQGDVIWHEDNECYYCDECYSEHNNLIYSYHDFNDWQEYKQDGEEPPYYIGFELEIDNNGDYLNYDVRDVHDAITSNINCVLMHDGSLSSEGIEIVSHPQSFNYLMAQYEKYDNIFNNLIGRGFTSHDNGRCGLHFHVTRPQNDEVVDRAVLLLENFKNEITIFSRRTSGQLSNWSQFMSDFIGENNDDLKSLYYIKKHKDNIDSSRYHALNTTNRKTIEFRFNRGTLNTKTFFASVELINNIMTLASDLSIEIDSINWLDLINGQYCYDYCRDKGLTNSHQAVDNTDKILKRQQLFKTKAREIEVLIGKYEKYLVNNYNSNYTKIKIKDASEFEKIARDVWSFHYSIGYIKDVKREIDRELDIYNKGSLLYAIGDVIGCCKSKYYKRAFENMKKEVELICA